MKAWIRTPGAIDPRRHEVEVEVSRRGNNLVFTIQWTGRAVELGMDFFPMEFRSLPESSEEKLPEVASDDIGDLL